MKISSTIYVFLIVFSSLLTVPVGAQSQTLKVCDTNNSCAGTSGLQQAACYENILNSEDRRLNDAYSRVLQAISNSGSNGSLNIEDKLRNSQRRWVAYRDSYCEFRGSTAEGGTITGILVLDCKCTLTRDKSDHLMDDLGNF